MSTRDELEQTIADVMESFVEREPTVHDISAAVIAGGWRKMPSRDEVLSALSNARRSWRDTITADAEVQWLADAILALMDGEQ